MENWHVAATKQTPAVDFDATTHTLVITGESYPENIAEFSTPLFNWLDGYLTELTEQIFTLNMELTYFNSSSSKMLLDLFARLEDEVETQQRHIVVNWIYVEENESALEYGEEFKEDLTRLTFNLVLKQE
ncbi:MAG: DUF1987 domain-containing protein [Thiotrichaceae bacterium]